MDNITNTKPQTANRDLAAFDFDSMRKANRPTPIADRCEKCARCLFAISEFVPDATAPFTGKSKPRVPGYRCHISRPGTNGFPIV